MSWYSHSMSQAPCLYLLHCYPVTKRTSLAMRTINQSPIQGHYEPYTSVTGQRATSQPANQLTNQLVSQAAGSSQRHLEKKWWWCTRVWRLPYVVKPSCSLSNVSQPCRPLYPAFLPRPHCIPTPALPVFLYNRTCPFIPP